MDRPPPQARHPKGGRMNRINPKFIPLIATSAVLLALYIAGCVLYPNFASLRVLINLFGDNAFIGVAAIGTTFVILSGGIDLSVGSVISFTTILIAVLIGSGTPPLPAIGIALVVGTAFGVLQGWLIRTFKLPPFLVTLAGMFFMRGLAFVVREESLAIKHPFFSQTIREMTIQIAPKASIPFTATCLVLAVVIATIIADYTKFGRNVYAIGSNEQSALLMGIPVGRTTLGVYGLAGFFAALGGVVATFYMQSGNPASFAGLELDAIAAVVIGGTLLTGGVGFIPGTLMGVLILGVIQTLIMFQGDLNTWWTRIAIGVLLLLFIVLQKAITRTRQTAAH
ncbi:MAG: sugar ABC transporter permease YjfF [Luteolibacter sp.]